MFPDYQARVLAAYQKKREAGQLSLRLLHPSPAQLRNECLAVLRDRHVEKDGKIIRDFFEIPAHGNDLSSLIEKFDIDKFRPLIKFIGLKTIEPERKHIELLAWLIDFEPRPYQFGQPLPEEVIVPTADEEIIRPPARGQGAMTNTVQTEKRKTKLTPILWALGIFLLAATGSYGTWHFINDKRGCAIWNGTQYQSIICDQQKDNTSVVVVDADRLDHFRLITRPDTLNEKAIGRVWYFKKNDSLELYTRGGYHPVHPERVVRKLSAGMYEKYVRPKKVYISAPN